MAERRGQSVEDELDHVWPAQRHLSVEVVLASRYHTAKRGMSWILTWKKVELATTMLLFNRALRIDASKWLDLGDERLRRESSEEPVYRNQPAESITTR